MTLFDQAAAEIKIFRYSIIFKVKVGSASGFFNGREF